jgi:hypothetical protein
MFKGRKCAGKMENVQEIDGKCTGIDGRVHGKYGKMEGIFVCLWKDKKGSWMVGNMLDFKLFPWVEIGLTYHCYSCI